MAKVTLDRAAFKALASDTRLDILRVLDGKKMSLKDISKATTLNKATLHEHLSKLHEVGLVKRKGREGRKWIYYKLSWKGECLLHPENTRIVVLFTATFVSLFFAIVHLVNYVRGYIVGKAVYILGSDSTAVYAAEDTANYLIPQATAKFSLAPIANIPIEGQTLAKLSQEIINVKPRGVLGNTLTLDNLEWKGVNLLAEDELSRGGSHAIDEAGEAVASSQSSMVAIAHDPALQTIAIVCLIIFGALLSIGIWRLWKNKTPKL